MPSAPASSATLTSAASIPGTRTSGAHAVPAVAAIIACMRLAADRPVLAIDDEEVGPGRGDRLCRHRRGDRAEDAVEDVALAGEPLLEEHRG